MPSALEILRSYNTKDKSKLSWNTGKETPLMLQKPELYNTTAQQSIPNINQFPERRSAYNSIFSELAFENIEPWSYFPSILGAISESQPTGENRKRRQDAWAMYLGKPQFYNTFEESKYSPSKSKDKEAIYYSIPDIEDRIFKQGLLFEEKPKSKGQMRHLEYFKKQGLVDKDGVMGHYKIDKGKDEKGDYISYYDKWDLHPPFLMGKEFSEIYPAGKPYEIYNRIYYNPQTGKRIEGYKQGGKTSIMKLLKY